MNPNKTECPACYGMGRKAGRRGRMNTPKVKSMKLTPREVKIAERAYEAGRLSAEAQIKRLQYENGRLSKQIEGMIMDYHVISDIKIFVPKDSVFIDKIEDEFVPDFQD